MNRWSASAPYFLSALRVITALLFLEHGLMKAIHFPVPQPGAPTPLPPILMLAAALEIVGGSLLAVGLFTRPVAFVLCGMMAVAYFIAHAPHSPWPGVNGGEAAILYCFVFLYLSTVGGGPLALDAIVRRRRI